MKSEFQKQQGSLKTDWALVVITIVVCVSAFYLALKAVSH